VGLALSMFLVGFCSYKITMLYYEQAEIEVHNDNLSKYVEELNCDGVAEYVSRNLILGINEENGQIKRIIIEICNGNTGNLDYITVPAKLEFTMSYDLYKKLATANSNIPQIINMKKIHQYFSGESSYQCAELLLEDLLDISFSYYTAIPETVCQEMFTQEKGSGIQKWSDAFLNEMNGLNDRQQYEEFFHKYYEKVSSNLSERDKCSYIPTYLKGGPKQVAFYVVSGEMLEDNFMISVEETNSLVNRILQNEAYKEGVQEHILQGESSIGLAMEVLNSTKINGLASSYQEKLIQQGMNVIRIGNYNDTTLEYTKIVVKQQGYGQDLLQYFENATVEVGELEPGVDIRIIIGQADGNS
jgi:hypothetical protein